MRHNLPVALFLTAMLLLVPVASAKATPGAAVQPGPREGLPDPMAARSLVREAG